MHKQSFRQGSGTKLELLWSSGRELQVLALICQALTPREIASKLNMSLATARGHQAKLLADSGCKNRGQLILFGLRNPKLLEGETIVIAEHTPDCQCLPCCAGGRAPAGDKAA